MLDKKGVGKRIAYYRKEHGMTQKDLKSGQIKNTKKKK